MLAPSGTDPELPRRKALEDKIKAVQNTIHSVDPATYQATIDELQSEYDKFGWTSVPHVGEVE